jgi:hypothetical protein
VLDVPGQITIDDAILECERDRRLAEQDGPIELERIGESFEFGYVILGLLGQQGWLVHVRAPFAGAIDGEGTRGIVVHAAHRYADVPDLMVEGRTVADCATPLMIECGKYTRAIVAARDRLEQQAAEHLSPLRKAS